MPIDEHTNLAFWQDKNPPRGETMATIDKRITDLEKAIQPPQPGAAFEVFNDRGELIFRQEFNPAMGKWINSEWPELRTENEYYFWNGKPCGGLGGGMSILDL